jgi:hypothetical protein
MAKSFWSKRKDSMQTAGGYIKATDSVSRPMALLMTVVGILIVGGLLLEFLLQLVGLLAR